MIENLRDKEQTSSAAGKEKVLQSMANTMVTRKPPLVAKKTLMYYFKPGASTSAVAATATDAASAPEPNMSNVSTILNSMRQLLEQRQEQRRDRVAALVKPTDIYMDLNKKKLKIL